MSFESLLGQTCEIHPQVNTINAFAAVDRDFGDGVTAKCRLNSRRGFRNDLQRDTVVLDTQYVLYLMPDVDISKEHKVVIDDTDYKVNDVRKMLDGNSNLHHLEVDLEVIT